MGNSTFSIFLIRVSLAFLCLSFFCLESGNADNTPTTAAAAHVKDDPSITPATASESKAKGKGKGKGRHRHRHRRRTWVSLPVTSRWYGAHEHQIPSEAEMLEWDAERVRSIQQARLNSNTPHPVSLDPNSGNYVVHVFLGQTMQEQRLILDSGSTRTWVECSTCKVCFKEAEKRFNPSNSTLMICGKDQDCKCGPDFKGRPCPFVYEYADKTTVSGECYKDKLTLGKEALNNFAFGCITSSSESPRAHILKGVSGIMGLHEGDNLTVFEQDPAQRFGRYFSYCLPTTKSKTGHLILGQKNDPPSGSVTSTKIVSDKEYFVKLEAISVDEVTIHIRDKDKTSTEDALIDSGAVWSWLPYPVYQALQQEFDNRIRKYNSKLTRDPRTDYLCYSNATANDKIPTIKLHFRDANNPLVLNDRGVMAAGKDGRRCLQFKGSNGEIIHDNIIVIGSSAQLTHNVHFDLDKETISFAPKGCS